MNKLSLSKCDKLFTFFFKILKLPLEFSTVHLSEFGYEKCINYLKAVNGLPRVESDESVNHSPLRPSLINKNFGCLYL